MKIQNYLPKTINDLDYDRQLIAKQIIDWIKNFNNEKNTQIILIGNHGVGKKVLINMIANIINYDVIKIQNNEIKSYNILDLQNNKRIFNNKKYLLMINNIDNITITDKKILSTINEKNMKQKLFPIIYLNVSHNKYLSILKKISNIYYINNPNDSQLYQYIDKILVGEKLLNKVMKKDKNIINNIINYSQYDYRKLNTIIELLINNENQIEYFIDFFNVISKKDTHIDLFKATKDIFQNKLSYQEIMNLYNQDKVLLPSMIFQNIPNFLPNNFFNNIDDVINSYEAISYSDLINTSMFIYQNWELQGEYGHFSCVESTNNLKKLSINKKQQKIDFSIDLNKLSQMKINKNTLRLVTDKLNIQQQDITYINEILDKTNLNTKYKTYINKFK